MSGGSRGESLVLALQGQPVPSAFASALALTHVLRYPTARAGRRIDSPTGSSKAKCPGWGIFLLVEPGATELQLNYMGKCAMVTTIVPPIVPPLGVDDPPHQPLIVENLSAFYINSLLKQTGGG
jgi:hypothetical protein